MTVLNVSSADKIRQSGKSPKLVHKNYVNIHETGSFIKFHEREP